MRETRQDFEPDCVREALAGRATGRQIAELVGLVARMSRDEAAGLLRACNRHIAREYATPSRPALQVHSA